MSREHRCTACKQVGHNARSCPKLGRRPEMIGRRFGSLLVTGIDGPDAYRRIYYLCACDCGGATTVRGDRLLAGGTVSCGCVRRAVLTRAGVVARLHAPTVEEHW